MEPGCAFLILMVFLVVFGLAALEGIVFVVDKTRDVIAQNHDWENTRASVQTRLDETARRLEGHMRAELGPRSRSRVGFRVKGN